MILSTLPNKYQNCFSRLPVCFFLTYLNLATSTSLEVRVLVRLRPSRHRGHHRPRLVSGEGVAVRRQLANGRSASPGHLPVPPLDVIRSKTLELIKA